MVDLRSELSQVMTKFSIGHDDFDIEVFKSGNINSTYKVDTVYRGEKDSFVIQRINTYVFPNPVGIMRNIDLVTGHIKRKLFDAGIDPKGRVLDFIKCRDGNNYYFGDNKSFWRIYRYIPNSITYNKAENLDILENAGFSFGNFQKQLADFPMKKLIDTMPDFHNTPARMENFLDAFEKNEFSRSRLLAEEKEILFRNKDVWSFLSDKLEKGELPLRVTHNDTKYNNILIDKTTGEAVCVSDLDTVIPGLCAYDFGDAVRFAANTAAEDDPDTSKVSLDLAAYEAFAKGFISAIRDTISETELESLAYGAVTMTFELSARFFEDYLRGDKYFKTTRPEHNIERGRNQLCLALDMLDKFDDMQKINKKYYLQ